jgi:hypothetical protein
MSAYAVCVLGNSHTAALQRAWRNRLAAAVPNVTLTFFAARSQKLRHVALKEGTLVPDDDDLAESLAMTSGGLSQVELGRYDAFLMAGLGARITLTSLCTEHGTVDHLQWGAVEHLVSRTCFRAMLAAGLTDNLAFWLLDRIRESGSAAPVLICPTPFYSDIELERPMLRKHPRLSDAAFRARVIDEGKAIAFEEAARHGGEIVWQDDSTIGSPGYTKRAFTHNALRLGKEASDDGKHMNEDYGGIVLTKAFERLDQLSGGRVLGGEKVVPCPGRKSA